KARKFVRVRAGVVEPMQLDALAASSSPPIAPDVIIGSYLFDTLPHEAWAVRQGKLVQQQVSVELPAGDAPECERAQLTWHDVEVDAPLFVRGYAPRVQEGSFLVPTGALECLKRVSEWANGRCLFLASDKGEPDVATMQLGGAPKLQRHGGISAMVNFDAIRCFWGWRP